MEIIPCLDIKLLNSTSQKKLLNSNTNDYTEKQKAEFNEAENLGLTRDWATGYQNDVMNKTSPIMGHIE